LGGVAHKPWRAKEVEKGWRVNLPLRKYPRRAGRAGAGERLPINSFKIELAKRSIVRALTTLAAMA
jgi:xanthine dehydrogenase YagS FAD-binding subunit